MLRVGVRPNGILGSAHGWRNVRRASSTPSHLATASVHAVRDPPLVIQRAGRLIATGDSNRVRPTCAVHAQPARVPAG
jgi:hypothetical protein